MVEQDTVVVIGAGAAGLMCAAQAGQRGRRVILLEHSQKIGEKIRISGGGRCNFTNLGAGYQNFLSDNPQFCRSALVRYTPNDFLELMKRYRIAWHEKHKGQLFCDDSAEDIIDMLLSECRLGKVEIRTGVSVNDIRQSEQGMIVTTTQGELQVGHVVVATGGLSIPKIGATDFAWRIAKQFELNVIAPKPALVPLTFSSQSWSSFVSLAGISLEVLISTEAQIGKKRQRIEFREDILFTHRGLSGPGVLQISSYWEAGQTIRINMVPDVDIFEELLNAKNQTKKQLATVLAQFLPTRLAEGFIQFAGLKNDQRLADMPDKTLRMLAEKIQAWEITPDGTEGYKKAEVTRGGVDTRELSQQSMMVKKVPGLYFIGEAVDVTGWLGGYNFQWAWASAHAAAEAIAGGE